MRRVMAFALLIVLGISITVLAQPVMLSPDFWDWHIVQNAPIVNYPVLAVARVIDGDTFEAWLLIAPRLAYFADIRLAGVDTPELQGNCRGRGLQVRDTVQKLLASASVIVVGLVGFDKYGRWVCSVKVDGVDLAGWISAHHLTKGDLCSEG